jgi:hypothetical protein
MTNREASFSSRAALGQRRLHETGVARPALQPFKR